jgi:hypothetical protein
VSIEDIFRTNMLALEHIVQEPETQIAGLTVIVDMNGFGFQHAKFLSPYYARRTVEVIQVPRPSAGFTDLNEKQCILLVISCLFTFVSNALVF